LIEQETWMDIKALKRQGMSIRQIARTTGHARDTVKRALEQKAPKRYGPRPPRPSKLDPYVSYLNEQLAARPWARATVLWREVREQGFRGHYEGVKRHVRALRREERARRSACVIFETGPGQESQFDWKGPIRGLLRGRPEQVLFIFRLLSCYSRYRITSVAYTLKLPEVLHDLQAAFTKLGGVTHRSVLDNFKAAVLRPRPNLVLHPLFVDFATHMAFEPAPALPYTPERKGKIERSFGDFVDPELLYRTYEDVDELQRALTEDDRRHAERVVSSTGQAPAERLEKERPFLLPLPEIPFDPRIAEPRKVFSDCTLSYGGARYSVPYQLVGKMLTVKQHPKTGAIDVFDCEKLVAAHPLIPKGQRSVIAEHVEELLKPRWERVRERAEKKHGDKPARTSDDVHQLVPWPQLSVDVRPVSVYAQLAEEGRP
jgi:transposase